MTEKIVKRRQSIAVKKEVREIRTTQKPKITHLRENKGKREIKQNMIRKKTEKGSTTKRKRQRG